MISEAIKEKRRIRLSYNGETRKIEPYTLGCTSAGKEVLRCFQVEGGSMSGDDVGWKLLSVEKIEDIEILEENFEVHEQYRINDKVMKEIYSQVGI